MALVLDPRTGQYVEVPDTSAAARLQAGAQQPVTGPRGTMAPLMPPTPAGAAPTLTPEQAYARGLQTTPPATMDPDVPTVPGQTWPLQPLQVSAGTIPVGQEPVAGVRDAAALATVNQGIAQALQSASPEAGILQPAQRGNYNMYNTDAAALPKPVSGGVNFGFGVNGAPTARQVLDRYAAQDAQAALEQRVRVQEATQAAELSRLQDLRNDPVAFRQQLRIVQALAPQTQAGQEQVATLAGLQRRNIGAEQVAELQSGATVQQQLLANQGRLQAAEIAGQYGVAEADLRARTALGVEQAKLNTPEGRKAAAEAALLETRLNAIRAGVDSGKLGTTGIIAATRSGQEPGVRYGVDPMTGDPTYRINPDGTITPIDPATLARIRATRQVPQAQ